MTKKPKSRPKVVVPDGGWQQQKQPVTAVDTPETKVPTSAPAPATEELSRPVAWQFSWVDLDGEWDIKHAGKKDVLASVLPKIASFESMTVRELFLSGTGMPGNEYDTATLPEKAKNRLVELGRDDETRIAHLRLTGKQRIWGFLRGHVLHVVWWDPEHQVWPSILKHT